MIIKSSKFCLLLRRVNYTWQFSAPFLCSITSVESAEYNLAIEKYVIHLWDFDFSTLGWSVALRDNFVQNEINVTPQNMSTVINVGDNLPTHFSWYSLDSMNHIEYVSCPEFKTYFQCTTSIFPFQPLRGEWFLSRAITSRHMKSVPSYIQVNYIGVEKYQHRMSAAPVQCDESFESRLAVQALALITFRCT